ncbi:MAG: glycosyl hydrolase 53 family protein [Spirochaetia bacterium]|nr:arabinogalactan endo-1,4-beta-galactosidase [Spirochaetota bacterium]MCX8096223.1 arabinogalactan endo-1,4-beta-galactosidase [Spirochaetota bacterium]MDW8112939.1 glycosyl hydrolase 53 family protein [Spirochaetia bacterium]
MKGYHTFLVLLFSFTYLKGYSSEFFKGADVSWLPQMEETGFVFYDFDGTRKDVLTILKENGMNIIRLRTWVSPSKDSVNGYCGKDDTIKMAIRCKKMGFGVMINFHYSDSWADPSKQRKPKDWEKLTFLQLKDKVYEYTYDFMESLKEEGIYPEFVQIGNEINAGMLWPDGSYRNFRKLASLISSGAKAVRDVSPNTKIVIHLANGHDRDLFVWFFENLNRYFTDYDVIGMSYYPYWIGKSWRETIGALVSNMNELALRYGKYVMVVETGGPHYEEEDTYEMIKNLIREVRNVTNKKGIGVLYWEPQGAFVWSRYSLSAWGDDGRPKKPIKAFLW